MTEKTDSQIKDIRLTRLTQSEIETAKSGASNFAKSLERANLRQLFLLSGAGFASRLIQSVYIGAKPIFYDDYNQLLKYFGNFFQNDKLKTVEDLLLYNPESVRKTIWNNKDAFESTFSNPLKISDGELGKYMYDITHPKFKDSEFDRESHHRQFGILCGIPKEDVEAFAINTNPEYNLYRFTQIHKKNTELNHQLRRSFDKLGKNGFDINELPIDNRENVINFLKTQFPLSFVNYLCSRKTVNYGEQYVTVTDSGDSFMSRWNQFFEASGIDQYLSSKYLFPLIIKKVRSSFNKSH